MNGNDTGTTQISAREILTVIFRRKVPIILCAVVVAAAALTAASRTTSVYQATAKVLLKRMGASPLAITWTPFYGLEEEMNTEVELVNTETVLARAVDILKEKDVYVHVESGDSQIAREPTVGDLSWGISAEPVDMSNIILIRYTGADPSFVGEAANAVAHAYVEYRMQVRRATGVQEFFGDQLAVLEARLLDLKETELALRKAGEIYDLEWQYHTAISRRNEVQLDLAEARSRRIAEEQKLGLIGKRLEEDPDLLVPFAEFERTKLGGQMLAEYWSLRKERDEKVTLFTDSNPQVRMLDDRIGRMEDRFREEVSRRRKEHEFLIEDLKAEERGFETALRQIDSELNETPEVVAQIEHLQKEIQYTYLHYEKLLEKMLDTWASEADDIRISNAKVISTANVQLTKAGKMATIYVAFSILLGATLGIGFGFLIENLDHSARSASDIEDNIGVPLLGSIPDSRRLPELTRRVDRTLGRKA
jgi:uncharacterized protein involved in exopolysaccharide biosynthesis